jgi:sugar lactone lactonase YvrE
MTQPAARLAADCRCTLGEGIVWSPGLRSVLWTDIEQSTLWMYRPHDQLTRRWSLPDRLGSFALCESGRLLLGFAKSLAFADLDPTSENSALQVSEILPIEPQIPRTRINDGRTDRSGNFVFGTYNEAQDGPSGSFYQYSSRFGLRRFDLAPLVSFDCLEDGHRIALSCWRRR